MKFLVSINNRPIRLEIKSMKSWLGYFGRFMNNIIQFKKSRSSFNGANLNVRDIVN